MIINLGDKTQVGFHLGHDHDMVVGVTDIATGASRIQHPASKNLYPKIKHKQDYGRSSSMGDRSSNHDS